MKLSLRIGLASAAMMAASSSASPQGRGDYLNFESPQVKPIAVATVDTRRYLFVCNTPDNSVDVFSLDKMELASEQVTTSPSLLPADPNALDRDRGYAARIPVGLEPVSLTVATIDGVTRLYTANWLGDSVTYVKLTSPAGISDQELAFTYEIERVVHVGDEPMCLAVMFLNDGLDGHLFVTKRTASSYSQLDAETGQPTNVTDSNPSVPDASGNGADVIMTTSGIFANAFDTNALDEGTFVAPVSTPSGVMAVKEPHAVAVFGSKLWVLGQQGGGSKLAHDSNGPNTPLGEIPGFNLDLWSANIAGTGITNLAIVPPMLSATEAAPATSGTGTTNFNMAANASWVYVVSTEAMNADIGNLALLSRSTGFVKTMLCKINANTLAITKRDLNLDTAGGNGAVPKGMSLAHCTDVALFRGQKVCVVAFNSDRFAIINTSNASPGLWSFERTNITASNDDDGSLTGVNIAGPRAIAVALDPNAPTGNQTQPGDRIYIFNRLDHSISVIDPNLTPAARQLFGFAMPNDPVPDYVRRGQQFLYSASLGSASGFVSCASCHIDARSDQQQWRLSSADTNLPTSIHAPLGIAVEAHEIAGTTTCEDDDLGTADGDGDGFPSQLASNRAAPMDPANPLSDPSCESTQFASNNSKGPMITPSLQGLLNFEVASGASLVTNAPYHWRGDKPDFDSFNEAFVNLQGLPDIDPLPTSEAGFTAEEMADYTTFINSVHYPPNPLQPRTRVYGGSPWNMDPASHGPDLLNPQNPDAGSGTLFGMKLFHILPTPGLRPRACVDCHTLTEGSNNRLTFIRQAEVDGANLYPAAVKLQPIESAALRGLTQKEGRLALEAEIPMTQFPATQGTDLRTGDLGTGHDGLEGMTRNDFLVVVINLIGLSHGVQGRDLLKDGIDAINDFVRRIDHGVAPMVGRSMSLAYQELPGQPLFSQSKLDLLEDMEDQVKAANSGLAVYSRLSGVERRFWYDVTSAGPGLDPEYQESPSTGTTLSRSELFGLLSSTGSDLLVFIATPLGSDLRVASAFGVGETLAGSAAMPSQFDMLDTRPNSAYRLIPTLTANTLDTDNPFPNHGLPDTTPFTELAPNLGDFRSLDAVDVLQRCFQFGNDNQNFHDAPRRIRVTASGLVPGARIRLHVPDEAGLIQVLEMPIYPTNEFAGSDRIWETAVELDPLTVYVLRLGGFNVQDVRDVLEGSLTEFYVVSSIYDWEFSNSGSAWNSGQSKFKYSTAIP